MGTICKLYHRKPRDMHGNLLVPLNVLKTISVEEYERQRGKYAGRETLMQQRVSPLGCLWNDVIHLSPIHPATLARCARAAGLGWQETHWFEIDPVAMGFNSENTAIFHYRTIDYGEQMSPAEFDSFDVEQLPALAEVRQSTRDYYQSREPGNRYLLFVGVPHVLHRGMLNVESTPIIWS
jgi:hypothetical protein